MNQIIIFGLVLSAIWTAKDNIKAVYQKTESLKKTKELLPLLFTGLLAWFLTHSKLYFLFPRSVLLLIGLHWCQSIMRMILSEITLEVYDWKKAIYFQLPLIIPVLLQVEALSSLFYEEVYFIMLMAYSIFFYCKMAYYISGELCYVLDMPHWWSIPQKNKIKESQ